MKTMIARHLFIFVLALPYVGVLTQTSHAGEDHAGHSHVNPEGTSLHFSHPLVTESPSPDNKIRLDYFFGNLEHGGKEHTVRLEAEYAFHDRFSIEIDVPYTFTDPSHEPNRNNLGDIDIGFKLATFAFAPHGIILGGGLELGLPTGDDNKDIGSDHVLKIEPFIDVGYKRDNHEVVAFLAFGIPTNEPDIEKDEEDLELEFNLAFSYHLTSHVTALFEIDGSSVVSGRDNKTVVNLTPGLKFRPGGDHRLEVGVGVSFPISNDNEFESQVLVSVFRHF